MILGLGQILEEITLEDLELTDRSAVFITDTAHAKETLEIAQINYEGEISLKDVSFCKMESQQECLVGSLTVPKIMDVLGSRFKLMFFINQKHIVIVDDDNFARRVILRIRQNRTRQGETKERFLYSFLTQIMSRDLEALNRYERRIMEMEEEIMDGKLQDFQNTITPVRKELLILRGYYDELMDLGKELEENENRFFAKKYLKYFGTVADRADRLMGRTVHLLDYANQVRDAYQEKVAEQQNKNMQFLTIVSTIFFPLTLITGWYGMNFQNMPELEQGYPGVIALSLIVVVTIIIIFKKKKIF
ncbi:MAG: cobalt transporter [Lachnospiraceae bacterium]|nr:cobalt transporter [Lachnospiraceae bacterium]